MKLNKEALKERSEFEKKGIILPRFDSDIVFENTEKAPTWIHFGAGNIFRGFIARVAQVLLNEGLSDTGVIAADTFDYEIINKIYKPHDNLTLMADLKPTGDVSYEVIGSIPLALCANFKYEEDHKKLVKIFTAPSLQLVSFTITEKGYSLRSMDGNLLPVVVSDAENGPSCPNHAMSIVCSMLLERFKSGALPLAVVSMDNCSHNGDKLKSSILEIASMWKEKGFVDDSFIAYLNDETKISFPWSMIDKITPRPDASVEKMIKEDLGIDDMAPITTDRGTFIAPFVNAEVPQYLVIEDSFPNGRPQFEKAGVYMTDRDTVNKSERMKVTTCLNPLHTSLAVFGCLLGYTRISDEMKNPTLVSLITKMGYDEGLKVVTDPKILSPEAFITEVIKERLPNPYIPDAPQRIATDTSLKVPIRFGETIKSYIASDELDVTSLTYIPLTIAGWFRYLLGVDDNGNKMELSSDPLMEDLQKELANVKFGEPESAFGNIDGLLRNKSLFAADLVECGLKEKIESMLSDMLKGNGAVLSTITKYVG
ncbi:MAG: mannitol dehydrogenase family protein [Clostridiales bacterium]|nr:mannitol dehydrogenase family protein [Clostridiales bacterium]